MEIKKGFFMARRLFFFVMIGCAFVFAAPSANAVINDETPEAFLIPDSGEGASYAMPISEERKVRISKNYGRLPLYFIENKGQMDEKVSFYEKGRGHTIFFAEDGIYLSLEPVSKRIKTVIIFK